MDDAKELIEQAKAEIAMFERPARATSLSMVEMIQEQAAKIAELEKKLSEVGDLALDKYSTDKYKVTAILFTISEDEVTQ
jgi:hypothetical protein